MTNNATLITLAPNTNARAGDMNANNTTLNNPGKYTFTTGSLARISFFIAAAGSGNYSHGLGAVPDSVQITSDQWVTSVDYQNVAYQTGPAFTSSSMNLKLQNGTEANVLCLKF